AAAGVDLGEPEAGLVQRGRVGRGGAVEIGAPGSFPSRQGAAEERGQPPGPRPLGGPRPPFPPPGRGRGGARRLPCRRPVAAPPPPRIAMAPTIRWSPRTSGAARVDRKKARTSRTGRLASAGFPAASERNARYLSGMVALDGSPCASYMATARFR